MQTFAMVVVAQSHAPWRLVRTVNLAELKAYFYGLENLLHENCSQDLILSSGTCFRDSQSLGSRKLTRNHDECCCGLGIRHSLAQLNIILYFLFLLQPRSHSVIRTISDRGLHKVF